jgi:hypothetical protein
MLIVLRPSFEVVKEGRILYAGLVVIPTYFIIKIIVLLVQMQNIYPFRSIRISEAPFLLFIPSVES